MPATSKARTAMKLEWPSPEGGAARRLGLLPTERRRRAQAQEMLQRLERFESHVTAALHEADLTGPARRMRVNCAHLTAQVEHIAIRVSTLDRRMEVIAVRQHQLLELAREIHRAVRWRLLLATAGVPALFAGWLWMVWTLSAR